MSDGLKIEGLSPSKTKILVDSGYNSIDSIKKARFEDINIIPGFGFTTTYKLWNLLGLNLHYKEMTEVNAAQFSEISIENKIIRPWKSSKTKSIMEFPPDYQEELTTVWSYPNRGSWASHQSNYRGNWPPQIVRNIICKYSDEGDVILDPMVGGGTTPVEALLNNRNSISVDINPNSLLITRDRLSLPADYCEKLDLMPTTHKTFEGDVRNLNLIEDESIDLIATHPPYVNIIRYAPLVKGDLSQINNYELFFKEFSKAIVELYRVLKPGKKCAILIGDTHNKSHFVPISTKMMIEFLKAGFILKEDIIKKEWNCESDRFVAKYGDKDFLLTMHEHLFIFEKPNGKSLKNSSIDFLLS